MSMIDCYEPDFVRVFLSHHPDSALHISQCWTTEIRQSLSLTDPASCQAALGDPNAFVLHATQCESGAQSRALSQREQVLNQAALNTVTLPGLSPELRLYATGIMLSFSEKCLAIAKRYWKNWHRCRKSSKAMYRKENCRISLHNYRACLSYSVN